MRLVTSIVVVFAFATPTVAQSKYGLNCSRDACDAIDQKAAARMANAKSVCTSGNSGISFPKKNPPSPIEVRMYWEDIDAAQRVAEYTYQVVADCSKAGRLKIENEAPCSCSFINNSRSPVGKATLACAASWRLILQTLTYVLGHHSGSLDPCFFTRVAGIVIGGCDAVREGKNKNRSEDRPLLGSCVRPGGGGWCGGGRYQLAFVHGEFFAAPGDTVGGEAREPHGKVNRVA